LDCRGNHLAVARWTGDPRQGERPTTTLDLLDLTNGNTRILARRNAWRFMHVALSPDGRRLAWTGSSWDSGKQDWITRELTVWDSVVGKVVLNFTDFTAQVRAMAFSTDGLRLAAANKDR